jgi:hypothetical protein
MACLDQLQVKCGSFNGEAKIPTARPDGVKQIYLQGYRWVPD